MCRTHDDAAADDDDVGRRVGHLGGGEEDQDGQRDDDDPDGLELAGQERLGALLDGLGDVLHRGGALVGGEDAPDQEQRHHDGGDGTDECEVQPELLVAGAARSSGNPLQPGGGSSVGLPSVYCSVTVDRVTVDMPACHVADHEGSRIPPPCEATAGWPGAGRAASGAPIPATGQNDTDNGVQGQGSVRRARADPSGLQAVGRRSVRSARPRPRGRR